MKKGFKNKLGKKLYDEITMLDCLICLSPIAKVFPAFKKIEHKSGPNLLGFDKGGFVVPKSNITSEEGN